MPKIRVLVVDDAVLHRRLVTEALSSDSELEVVGLAANGRIGLQKIPQCNPDVITLDLEMPVMDGLQMLRELRRTYPKLPVIMFSSVTGHGAQATLDALALGASDYAPKPAGSTSLPAALDHVRADLIPRIKTLCRKTIFATVPHTRTAGGSARSAPAASIDLLTIGVSTGGPNALAVLLPALRADLPVPVLIVQHMPPMFTRLLAERLDTQCPLRVREAAHGDPLEPGVISIAPGNFHMAVHRVGPTPTIAIHQDPPENSCRPAVDVLFRSAAQLYGEHVLGVILTGMGQDGLRGCEQIAERGGRIFVQDEASSVVWGMPGFVARAGLAQKVLPLDAMAAEIVRTIDQSRPASKAS